MDAKALHEDLLGRGFALQVVGSGLQVEPSSALTDELRGRIRGHREGLIALALASEIRRLLGLFRCGADHHDHAEALALALASPDVHLEGLRASAVAEGLL